MLNWINWWISHVWEKIQVKSASTNGLNFLLLFTLFWSLGVPPIQEVGPELAPVTRFERKPPCCTRIFVRFQLIVLDSMIHKNSQKSVLNWLNLVQAETWLQNLVQSIASWHSLKLWATCNRVFSSFYTQLTIGWEYTSFHSGEGIFPSLSDMIHWYDVLCLLPSA